MHTPTTAPDSNAPATAPEVEHQLHNYKTSRIPWFVHLIWISFWIVAVSYIWRYLIPAMRVEIPNPP